MKSIAPSTDLRKAAGLVPHAGGKRHPDMCDLKPGAPVEFRGEFGPMRTDVPGVQIWERFPKTAKKTDKFAMVRCLFSAPAGTDEASNLVCAGIFRLISLEVLP